MLIMSWDVRQTLFAVCAVAHRELVSWFRLVRAMLSDGKRDRARGLLILKGGSGVTAAPTVRRFGGRGHAHLQFRRG